MKNGAIVHGARDEVELQRVVDKLGVEIVLAAAKPPWIGLIKETYFSWPTITPSAHMVRAKF